MRQYVVQRLLLLVPTVIGITLLVAGLVRLLPGDIVDVIMGESGGQVNVTQLRRELGLDKSFPVYYADWAWSVLHLNFGKTLRGGTPISDELKLRIPVTLELSVLAMIVSIAVSLPVGTLSAIRQDTFIDYLGRSFAITAIAMPSFWWATLAVVFIPVFFGKAVPTYYQQLWVDPVENLEQMWLPALILGLGISGSVMRLLRSTMLEVLRQDYVRTAWAKGLQERSVILRHVMRSALIPVVTLIGIQIPFLIGGSVVLETIFVLPGMGQLLLNSLFGRDYPVVLAINLIVALVVVGTNLLIDLTVAFLDPRIRLA
jgi:peptide/nickel transport system permease protein